MADDMKREEEHWLRMQQSLDLLSSKVEVQGASQHQMVAQLEITTQVRARSSKDQLAFAQQLLAASDVIVRLVTESHPNGGGAMTEAGIGLHNTH
jgi:hypothetical protein